MTIQIMSNNNNNYDNTNINNNSNHDNNHNINNSNHDNDNTDALNSNENNEHDKIVVLFVCCLLLFVEKHMQDVVFG